MDEMFEKTIDEFLQCVHLRRKQSIYEEIMQNYQKRISTSAEMLEDAKSKILRYRPGFWIEEVGGLKKSDYEIPRTTTLLMIGLKGSGKSSLVNKISKVFESDGFFSSRAQVFFNQAGDGSYFLQEYMIPRDSTSFCLYDTRSLSENQPENFKLIRQWISEGVRHGQMVISESDNALARKSMKIKARCRLHCNSERRKVNFVIFVVDGVSVQKSMANEEIASSNRLLTELFNFPYLCFQDDKPVLLIMHVDELSLSERAHMRIYLGDLLGIPPATQIFDIPDKHDPLSELTLVEMLRYCLEHADRNLPVRQRDSGFLVQFHQQWAAKILVIVVALFVHGFLLFVIQRLARWPSKCDTDWHFFDSVVKVFARKLSSEPKIDWHSIRHMWMG